MATVQSFVVCDNSTLTNFKSWAQTISNAFSTFGWAQSADTGQVNWSTIAAVPGSGSLVYEIWKPNDGLTNFYFKVEYGNSASQTNSPDIRISLSNSTDGAGNLNGFVMGPWRTMNVAVGSGGAATTYECNLSGSAGRFCCMMWRNFMPVVFAVERSINASGTYTSSYVSMFAAGGYMQFGSRVSGRQQSLVFGIGAAPASLNYQDGGSYSGLITRSFNPSSGNTYAFNGGIGMDLCTPFVGGTLGFDNPCTALGICHNSDIAEGVPLQASVYGSTRTYMPTKAGYCYVVSNSGIGVQATLMRYD